MADSAIPQLRRQLRARRLAEKQAQMAAALAEKQARDVKESTEKERKVELREENKQRMAAWRQVRAALLRQAVAAASHLWLTMNTAILQQCHPVIRPACRRPALLVRQLFFMLASEGRGGGGGGGVGGWG